MEKVSNHEERPDYLMGTFENFFRYAKYNHFKIPFEALVDAIGGGLSGANFPEVNRTELLQCLIDSCKFFEEAAKRNLELRRPVPVREAEAPAPINDVSRKAFLNIDEVCTNYSLPKSNIKDRAWRESHDFPCIQTSDRSRVIFKREDVENWINQHQKH